MEERITCAYDDCNKLFGMKINGDIFTTPSTTIRFITDEEVVVEIMCGRCKKKTKLIFK